MNAWERVETELSKATERARTLVDNTPARLFTVRPSVTQWSAAECVAHLSISTEMFLPALRRAVDDARKRGLPSNGDPKMDFLGSILRWFLEPPVRARTKTTPAFVPKSTRAKGEALAEFTTMQNQLTEVVRSSRDLAIARVKLISPFDRRVKYNIYSAFLIIAAHQRRHLWQAEQAVAALRRAQTID
jgi:hypothetical protein